MGMFGRIILFLLVNAVIVITMSLILNLLGVQPYLTPYGLDIKSLAMLSLVWGMGCSVMSLMFSRALCKFQDRVQVIPPNTTDPGLRQLLETVHNLSRKAGLTVMPEVGITDKAEPNAYATGPTKSMALVVVTTGLLSRMNRSEVEGVLGHEVSHIANGDMVTMALLQGVMNAFVIFLSKLVAFAIMRGDDNNRRPGFMYYIVEFLLQMVFMLFASVIIAGFSRWREFRADAGSARLVGKEKMIAALQELERTFPMVEAGASPAVATLQITSRPSGLMKLLASHPPLEERIRRLQEAG